MNNGISPLLRAEAFAKHPPNAESIARVNGILNEIRPDVVYDFSRNDHQVVLSGASQPLGRELKGGYAPFEHATVLTTTAIYERDTSSLRRTIFHETLGHALLNQANFISQGRWIAMRVERFLNRTLGASLKKEVREAAPFYRRYQQRGRVDQARYITFIDGLIEGLPGDVFDGHWLKQFYKSNGNHAFNAPPYADFCDALQRLAMGISVTASLRSVTLREVRQSKVELRRALLGNYGIKEFHIERKSDGALEVTFKSETRNKYVHPRYKASAWLAGAAALAAGFSTGFVSTAIAAGLAVMAGSHFLPALTDGTLTHEQTEVPLVDGAVVPVARSGKTFKVLLPEKLLEAPMVWSRYAFLCNDAEEYLCEALAHVNNVPEMRSKVERLDPELFGYVDSRFGRLAFPRAEDSSLTNGNSRRSN